MSRATKLAVQASSNRPHRVDAELSCLLADCDFLVGIDVVNDLAEQLELFGAAAASKGRLRRADTTGIEADYVEGVQQLFGQSNKFSGRNQVDARLTRSTGVNQQIPNVLVFVGRAQHIHRYLDHAKRVIVVIGRHLDRATLQTRSAVGPIDCLGGQCQCRRIDPFVFIAGAVIIGDTVVGVVGSDLVTGCLPTRRLVSSTILGDRWNRG